MKIPVNKFLAIVLAVIYLFGSLTLLEYYQNGDQIYYHALYNSLIEVSLLDSFQYSLAYISSFEPGYVLLVWTSSKIGFDKNIVMAISNSIFVFILLLFLYKNKVKWRIIFLILTNFYFIVLLTSAERLKFAYIFLLLFTISEKSTRKYLSIAMACLSHFQSVILVAVAAVSNKYDRIVSILFLNRIKLKEILIGLLFVVLVCLFIYVFSDVLFRKMLLYTRFSMGITELFQIILISPIAIISAKNKGRMISLLLLISIFALLLGGNRVNMIAFSIILYFLIVERRTNNLYVTALLSYFSIKSIPYIYNIIVYGDGFFVN